MDTPARPMLIEELAIELGITPGLLQQHAKSLGLMPGTIRSPETGGKKEVYFSYLEAKRLREALGCK